jgi:glutamate synthase (NADPH/NADH)
MQDASGRFQMIKVPGTERVFEADFVFLALGFISPEQHLAEELGLQRDGRSNFAASAKNYATNE